VEKSALQVRHPSLTFLLNYEAAWNTVVKLFAYFRMIL
jgi:hypothetical protein